MTTYVRGGLLAILALALLLSTIADAAPVFGRYVGTLRHDRVRKEQLAKIDFFVSREGEVEWELMAILTLHFGDFRSGEYVAYHFDKVRYSVASNSFIFDQPDQDVSIVSRRFTGDELHGELRSSFGGLAGRLVLHRDRSADPQLPLVEPVSGEYAGVCKDVKTRLQLFTYRSPEDTTRVGNPFASYRIRGMLGEDHGSACIGSYATMCLLTTITAGSYNFYRDRLVLYGTNRNLVCEVKATGLVCDGCALTRVSGETAGPRALAPAPKAPAGPAAPALSGALDALEGTYSGYVHHDYLDRDQAAELNILAYQDPASTVENPILRMSAVATVYFGGFDSAESISYRFSERVFPRPLLTPQFVFKRTEGDVDAVLEVTRIGDGIVEGNWYSTLFGRVGRFALRKGAPAAPPVAEKLMEKVSGSYDGMDYDLGILVGLGKTPPNTENPFFPLSIGGHWQLRNLTPIRQLSGGTYDFYTGRIGIESGDSPLFIGERLSRKSLRLRQVSFNPLTPLRDFPLRTFRLVSE